jgi:hypothetical protein
MITKIMEIIKECESEAPQQSCKECVCSKKECLMCLLQTYNEMYIDDELEYEE